MIIDIEFGEFLGFSMSIEFGELLFPMSVVSPYDTTCLSSLLNHILK